MSEIVLASNQLAARIGVEKQHMLATIKAQCFKCDPDRVSDTQLAAFVSIANEMGVNPLLPGMIYAFPDGRGGIVPMMGPDGVMKKLAEMKGVTYECIVYPEDVTQPPTHATASIYVEGKERPYTYTAVFSEWATSNWSKKPRHWCWLRALKQCARQVIHGLPFDEEEARAAGMLNVTDTGTDEAPAEAVTRPKVSRRGGAAAAAASEPAVVSQAVAQAAPAKKADATTVDAEIVENEPSAEDMARAEKEAAESAAKAEREATEKALKEREAKAKADAAKKSDAPTDLSKVPEVIPGVSIHSFMGKAYPVTVTGTIKSITTGAQGATLYAKALVDTPQGEFEVAIFNTAGKTDNILKKDDGTLGINNPALRVDALIEFSLSAKLRGSKEKDPATGKPKPDLTRAPALIASDIRDAEESLPE